MITLRPYQKATVEAIWSHLYANDGNPCVVLPTGAGKSIVIAAFIKEAEEEFPDTKVLLLSHQKELVEQDAEKLRLLGLDVSIYCAGANMKEVGTVTAASIQSIARHPELLGPVDIMIVDECHLMNDKAEGQYRTLHKALKEAQPGMRLIGFTATPFRTGHGWICGKNELFDEHIINLAQVETLQEQGYLSPLTSKATKLTYNLGGVKKTMGDYVESELAKRVNTKLNNRQAVEEVIRRAEGRKSILVFCAGVDHAIEVQQTIIDHGETCGIVVGTTEKNARAQTLSAFKSGEIRFIVNANVLTTGFDAPNVDCIAMLRPTLSPVLYMQMLGRGLRVCEGKKDCLVLDFAGNVRKHGSVLDVNPENMDNMFNRAKGKGNGVAPAKICPDCDSIIPVQCRKCPDCGHDFGAELVLRLDDSSDVNGARYYACSFWKWFVSDSLWECDIHCEDGEILRLRYPRFHDFGNAAVYRAMKEALGNHRASELYPPRNNTWKILDEMNHVSIKNWFVKARKNQKGWWTIIQYLKPEEEAINV